MSPGALARKHLDRRLKLLQSKDAFARPPRGWVRAIRDALNMTSRQLAARIGVSQSSVAALEKSEIGETVSLATLKQAAEALDCHVVYALVPNTSLEETMRRRAHLIADKQLARGNHTMRLENQALVADDLASERERLIDDLVRTNSRRLWDEP